MKPKAEHIDRIQAAAAIAIAATAAGEADDSAADHAAAASPFDEIYDTYAPLMRRIAVAKFGISANDAADLVHDVFATYLVNPSRVTELRPYLIGAICNASRSYLRRTAAKDAVCSGLDDCLAASDQGLLDAVVRDVLVGRILGRLGRSCRHEAIEALARAESFHRHAPNPELDIAIIAAIRAWLFSSIDDFDGSDECAKSASELFSHLGQELRSLPVMNVQSAVLSQRGEFARNIETRLQIREIAESIQDPTWQRVAALNLAWAYQESGDPLAAEELFLTARIGFAEVGFLSDVTRCEWGLALVARDLGSHREALAQLLAVSASFAEQKVVVDSATAMVEAFEIMLALGEPNDIERLATGLVETLTEAGRMESALTALAYVKEAAARKSITAEILRAARTFLRRVDRHRDLIFAPPPLS